MGSSINRHSSVNQSRPGSWIMPGTIQAMDTESRKFMRGIPCQACGQLLMDPTYYQVEFHATAAPGKRYFSTGRYGCSPACAEQLAAQQPTHEPIPYPTEGAPSDPTLRQLGWLYALRETPGYPDATERSGKWMAFVKLDEVDAFWERVRTAIQAGKLGDMAKVGTTPSANKAGGIEHRVVCIYSYDSADEDDVWRIRASLRELGVSWEIYYKLDAATRAGIYSGKGTKASLYRG